MTRRSHRGVVAGDYLAFLAELRRIEADLVLDDGATVHVRPICRADYDREERFFNRVSAESAYQRFFHFKRTLSPDEIRALTTVDYEDRLALIALHEGEMVGVARYEVIADATLPAGRVAELAMLVEDDFQGRGLGKHLLSRLAVAVRRHGIVAFEAHIQPGNHRMFRLIGSCGLTVEPDPRPGVYVIELSATR